ncbi:MAG: DUF4834 family protein [Pedobacter sp.]|nr:MAG: DUF4834 family protein [Pedobacter sp.]
MAFIKFILISFLVFYILRVILRLIFPVVLKNMFSKVQQKAQQQQQQQNTYGNQRREGDISIEYMPPQPKQGNADKLGDFVDYEEVK